MNGSSDSRLRLAPGSWVGSYLVLNQLGAGGMGAVYTAQASDGRVVAIKLLLDEENSRNRQRFERELNALMRLDHPNIVGFLERLQLGSVTAIVQERVAGRALSDLLQDGQRWSINAALRLCAQLGKAVAAVHEASLVHRDLKPDNILIRDDGQPMLIDFGLSRHSSDERLTHTGELVGTPAYMAPEQIDGRHEDIGPQTDVWALAVILVELTTGKRPFVGFETASQLAKILFSEPVIESEEDLPPGLRALCLAFLTKDPQKRPRSAASFARACEELASGSKTTEFSPPERRRWPAFALAGIVAALVFVAAAWGLNEWRVAGWAQGARAPIQRLEQCAQRWRQVRDVVLARRMALRVLRSEELPKAEETEELARVAEGAWRSIAELQREAAESAARERALRDLWPRVEAARAELAGLLEVSGDAPKTALWEGILKLEAGEPAEASVRFTRAAEREPAGRIGLIVAELESRAWDKAKRGIERVESPELLPYALALEAACVRGRARELAEGEAASEAELRHILQELPAEARSQLYGDVEAALAEPTEARLRAAVRLIELRSERPGWPELKVPDPVHLPVGERLLSRGHRALAAYHLFRAKVLDPEARLPEAFQIEDLERIVTELLLSKSREQEATEEIAFILFAGSRAGFVPSFMNPDFVRSAYRIGVIEKMREIYPTDPVLDLWESICPPLDQEFVERPEAARRKRIAAATRAIAAPDLHEPLRAQALTRRAQLRVELVTLGLEQESALDLSEADLRAAEPMLQLSRDEWALCWLNIAQLRRDWEAVEVYSQRAMELLDEKNRRTKDGTLGEGRPMNYPLAALMHEPYTMRMSNTLMTLAEAQEALGKREEALATARRCLEFRERGEAVLLQARLLWEFRRLDELGRVLERDARGAQRPALVRYRELWEEATGKKK